MSACVRSGWCCKQGPCPFGEWDEDLNQCKFLVGSEIGQYSCSKYDEIVDEPANRWGFSPAFGFGCSSALNPDRQLLIRKRR